MLHMVMIYNQQEIARNLSSSWLSQIFCGCVIEGRVIESDGSREEGLSVV